MANKPKVRFEEMLPHEIAAAREKLPVAYLPLGGMEWHGRHNCVGLDAVKAHAMCCHFAEQTGGVVFPALYYGDEREKHNMEVYDPDGIIAADYGLTRRNFAPGHMRGSPHEANTVHQALMIIHILHEIISYGFEVIAIGAGHYPLLPTARGACQLFYKDRGQIAWAYCGFELVRDTIPNAGDHAGPWETSLMMALRPDLVDLSKAGGATAIPGLYERVQAGSSVEYGQKALAAMTKKVNEINLRLLAALRSPEPSLFDVPLASACRGAKLLAKLREDEAK